MRKRIITIIVMLLFALFSVGAATAAEKNNGDLKTAKVRAEKISAGMVKEFAKGGNEALDAYLASEGI